MASVVRVGTCRCSHRDRLVEELYSGFLGLDDGRLIASRSLVSRSLVRGFSANLHAGFAHPMQAMAIADNGSFVTTGKPLLTPVFWSWNMAKIECGQCPHF